MDTHTKTQTPSKKNRAAIIAAALGAALCLALAPLLTPQADASLSNGHMCIMAKSTTDPEIEGMAGNCDSMTTPEEPEYVPVAFHRLSVSVPTGSPLAGETVSVVVLDAETGEILSEKSDTVSTRGYLNFNFGLRLEKDNGYRSLIIEASFKGESRTHTLLVKDGYAYTARTGDDVLNFGGVYLTATGTVYYDGDGAKPTW